MAKVPKAQDKQNIKKEHRGRYQSAIKIVRTILIADCVHVARFLLHDVIIIQDEVNVTEKEDRHNARIPENVLVVCIR